MLKKLLAKAPPAEAPADDAKSVAAESDAGKSVAASIAEKSDAGPKKPVGKLAGLLKPPTKAEPTTGGGVGGMGRLAGLKGLGGIKGLAGLRKMSKASVSIKEPPEYEPTYRMEPNKKLKVSVVEGVLKEVVNRYLGAIEDYSPKLSCRMIKVISDEIKDKIKMLSFDRYKVVVVIVLGQKKDQCAMVSSRCTWDLKFDSHATYTFQNEQYFCNVTAYGLYRE